MTAADVITLPTGHRLHVDPGDPRARALAVAGGDLNPLSRRLWRRVLRSRPWELVVDVGVNYGEMLVGIEVPAGAAVIGFEPNPAVRALARRTLGEAGLAVDLRGEAVAGEPGVSAFAVDTTWSGTSVLGRPPDGDPERWRTVEVPVTTLDEVVDARVGSFCVKVDVEGREEQVVAGAARSLARDVPWVLRLEVLHMPDGLLRSLAERHAVLLLDADADRLVRVAPDETDAVLASGAVYPQDCLLAGPAALPTLGCH